MGSLQTDRIVHARDEKDRESGNNAPADGLGDIGKGYRRKHFDNACRDRNGRETDAEGCYRLCTRTTGDPKSVQWPYAINPGQLPVKWVGKSDRSGSVKNNASRMHVHLPIANPSLFQL